LGASKITTFEVTHKRLFSCMSPFMNLQTIRGAASKMTAFEVTHKKLLKSEFGRTRTRARARLHWLVERAPLLAPC